MVLTTINGKIKKALLSLVLVPVWDHVLQVEDDCKAHSSKTKPTGTVEKPSQTEIVELKYHGTYGQEKSGSSVSYLDQFMLMQAPFDVLSPMFATVSTEIITSDTASSLPPEQIRLSLSKIVRTEDTVALGAKAHDIRNMMSKKNLKNKGSGSYMPGRTLKRAIDMSLRGVRKLLAYEKSYLTPTGDIPSGDNEDDLQKAVLDKAFAALCYSESKNNSKSNANEEDIDSDINGDATNEISVQNNDKVPDDYVAPKEMPDDWTPDGWATYTVYACKTTRCTDKFLHVFSGCAKDMQKAGAKSRKQAKKEKRDEVNTSRDSEIGGKSIGGVRGMSFEHKSLVVNAGIKRSADKVFSLCANTAAFQKKEERLIERKNQFIQQMQLYQKMMNVEGVAQKLMDLMSSMTEIDIEIQRASEECSKATNAQTMFADEDETGKKVDEFLAISLNAPSAGNTMKSRPPVSSFLTPPPARNPWASVSSTGGGSLSGRSTPSVREGNTSTSMSKSKKQKSAREMFVENDQEDSD